METPAEVLAHRRHVLLSLAPRLLPTHFHFHLCDTQNPILVPASLAPLQLCPLSQVKHIYASLCSLSQAQAQTVRCFGSYHNPWSWVRISCHCLGHEDPSPYQQQLSRYSPDPESPRSPSRGLARHSANLHISQSSYSTDKPENPDGWD